jgi:hypothetical protein
MSVTEQLRAALERVAPWYDVVAERAGRTRTKRAIAHADKVLDDRKDEARDGYRAYGDRAKR